MAIEAIVRALGALEEAKEALEGVLEGATPSKDQREYAFWFATGPGSQECNADRLAKTTKGKALLQDFADRRPEYFPGDVRERYGLRADTDSATVLHTTS